MSVQEAWDKLVEEHNVSEEALKIVTSINGYSVDTLEDVLYVVSGYRSFEQLEYEENEKEES